MYKITQLFRDDYTGEDVITKLTYKDSKWNEERSRVENSVINVHSTTQALVVGGGKSWQEGEFAFDMSHVKRHKGGLYGTNRLQTYGTNLVYKKFKPDFLVVDDDVAERAVQDGAVNDIIVYAHAKKILEFPGRFYLIPQDPSWNAGAIAAYMACFDGHKKIFLMGFDGRQGDDVYYERSMVEVFKLYPEVEFVRVAPTTTYYMPELWKYLANVRQVDYRGFIIEADLG